MTTQGVNSDGEVLQDFYTDNSVGREMTDVACDPAEGMTRQEFADECDINVLMATYERSGVLPRFNDRAPAYLDVSDVPDLARALEVVQAAETAFMTLPATVRREFDNNAVAFAEYASDPANLEQMRKWGLAAPAPMPPSASAEAAGGVEGAGQPSEPPKAD